MKGNIKMPIPDKVLAGLEEALDHANSRAGGRAYKVRLRSPEEIRELRANLNLTQKEFAEQFGISFQTVQKWEQGKRKPEGAANAFLTVLARMPSEVMNALQADKSERVSRVRG